MKPERIEILSVPVDCLNMDSALEAVETMITGDKPQAIIAVNPEKVIKAQKDPSLMSLLRKTGLLIPDGIGVVLAARFLKLGQFERVAGSELMPVICEMAAKKGYRVFLFGASPEVNKRVVQVLHERFPDLQITGNQDGFVKENEMPVLIERINQSRAQILFLALGSPKQELWMEKYLPQLETVRACQGVGGTFDVIAGSVKRAPQFFIKMNSEWLYRLLSQPQRIFRQSALPIFACKVLFAFFNKKRT